MSIKNPLIIISITLLSGMFAFSALAQEATSTDSTSSPQASSGQATSTETATSTPEIIPEIATTTPEIVPEIVLTPPPPVVSVVEPPVEEPATSTSSGQATSTDSTDSTSSPQASSPQARASSEPQPNSSGQATSTPPVAASSDEASLAPLEREPTPEPTPLPSEASAQEGPPPVIDSATAPSKVTIRVMMPDGAPPPFPVFVTFVGVGNKNFGGKINANGELTVTMPQGRYYTELLVISTEYVQGEDGPSFFLEANEERDFGAIRLIPKSELISQSLEDKTLEADILAQAGEAKGIGKVLVLIVKLLMKILEEVRAIAQKL